jgi:cbb3-type cytochrome oxidase subunit 3
MEWPFGIMEVIFLVFSCIVIFIQRRMKKSENEIDKVLAEAEQVKYKNMVREVMYCKSEIVNGQIFVYEKDTSAFITQQPNVESLFKYFINNYPNKRIQFGE